MKKRFTIKKINTASSKKSSVNFKLSPLNPYVAGIDIGAASIFTCAGFADGHQEVKEHLTRSKGNGKMAQKVRH